MKPTFLALCLTILACREAAAQIPDLSKVERKIAKEPEYKSKAPKYCLLVFGPEAAMRVWLVLDGDTLYVDRNGNGDLTELGERIPATEDGHSNRPDGPPSFEVSDIREGELIHKNLRLSVINIDYLADERDQVRALLKKSPKARGYALSLEVEMPGWKGHCVGGRVEQLISIMDVNGVLQFGNSPDEAPLIHFRGPWQVTLYGKHTLTVGREQDLYLAVGTPGVGPGTTAFLSYDLIPRTAFPHVAVVYAASGDGAPPVRESYELPDRC